MDGLRVGVTAGRKGAELATALRRRGAEVVHGPTVAGDQPAPDAEIVAAIDVIIAAQPGWFVASTGAGMRLLIATAEYHDRLTELGETVRRARCAARGPKAVGALQSLRARTVFVSAQETDADVAGWLSRRLLPRDTVAVQLHGGHCLAYSSLEASGAHLITISPYTTGLPSDVGPAATLIRRAIERRLDVITVTSPSAARNLMAIAADLDCDQLLLDALAGDVATAAIGSATATALDGLGIPVALTPVRSRTGDLVRSLDAWQDRGRPGSAGHRAAIRLLPGRSVATVNGRQVPLGSREYAILAALVHRPGVVCPTETLLTEAWGHDAPTDPAAVKHHIARLRRKLGDEAITLTTVRGIGYRYTPDLAVAPTRAVDGAGPSPPV